MTTAEQIRNWLVNEPIYRVELKAPSGPWDKVNYMEAADENDARSSFRGERIVSIRRAVPSDAKEFQNWDF